jgi:mono/diheme cytochrome c family protein
MGKALKWIGIGIGSILALLIVVGGVLALVGRARLNGRYEAPRTIAVADSAPTPEVLARGKHVVEIHGCLDCHAEALQGKVFLDIPPGRFVASNLTRGRGGVGARYATPADWDHAVRYGVRPDGRWITPFMPYHLFNHLSDEDAIAVASYLGTVAPVDNELPPTDVRIPGYIMLALQASPTTLLASLDGERTQPPIGPTAEYGRYLTSTTCIECHGQSLQGGRHPAPGAPPGPELSHAGQWSLEDFARAMRTGVVPGGRQLSDFMPWKVFRNLTDTEVEALHTYLKTLPLPDAGAVSPD